MKNKLKSIRTAFAYFIQKIYRQKTLTQLLWIVVALFCSVTRLKQLNALELEHVLIFYDYVPILLMLLIRTLVLISIIGPSIVQLSNDYMRRMSNSEVLATLLPIPFIFCADLSVQYFLLRIVCFLNKCKILATITWCNLLILCCTSIALLVLSQYISGTITRALSGVFLIYLAYKSVLDTLIKNTYRIKTAKLGIVTVLSKHVFDIQFKHWVIGSWALVISFSMAVYSIISKIYNE